MGGPTRHTPEKTKKAVQVLRRLHAAGTASLVEHGQRMTWGGMSGAAKEKKLGEEVLRKARAFAAAYTPKQMERLCDECEKRPFAFGVGHLFRILSIPEKHRNALQQEMILRRWSKGRLDVEIHRRFGNRRPSAGRAWEVPADMEEACYRILGVCDRWRRLGKALEKLRSVGHTSRASTDLQLPEHIRRLLRETSASVLRLEQATVRKLQPKKRRTPPKPR